MYVKVPVPAPKGAGLPLQMQLPTTLLPLVWTGENTSWFGAWSLWYDNNG
jgi:hypothetical protein